MTQVERVVTGVIQENCYIIYKNNKALIVDPGNETNKIKDIIESLEVLPVAILLTHTHYDHIGSVEDLRIDYEIPVYVSPIEQSWLGNPSLNLSIHSPGEVIVNEAEYEFKPTEIMTIDDFSFTVVPTPGHSPGSVSLIFEDDQFVVSGDALFAGSIGRTDLPEADHSTLINSIKNQLFTLPDHFRVYPGHSETTTIGYEREKNPFFN